jgi:hypothetical protein
MAASIQNLLTQRLAMIFTEVVTHSPSQWQRLSRTGMHFPAADIPIQARQLYKVNRIRILYDRDEETARLVRFELSNCLSGH